VIRLNSDFVSGSKKALPIVLGYLPIGFAYGVLAREVGLNLIEIGLMSLLIYAGSSQFIAVGMIGSGAALISIVITTFLVNLRHLLMSASLAPYFKQYSRKLLPLISFGITDETFAVNAVELKADQKPQEFVLGLHLTSHISWILGGLFGGAFHQLISDTDALGLDFVLYAMFIFLLLSQLDSWRFVGTGLVAGATALLITYFFPETNWHIIIAAVVAATSGVVFEWIKE